MAKEKAKEGAGLRRLGTALARYDAVVDELIKNPDLAKKYGLSLFMLEMEHIRVPKGLLKQGRLSDGAAAEFAPAIDKAIEVLEKLKA
jgi:hypothetical protein